MNRTNDLLRLKRRIARIEAELGLGQRNASGVDSLLENFNLKSHSLTEIKRALRRGQDVYELETGNAGEDDILIAGPGESYDDVLNDVLYQHGLDRLPRGWTLNPLL